MTSAVQTTLAIHGLDGRGATFVDGVYRYALWRTWDTDLPPAMFVGLNPSTADAEHDDPTIRRCKRFAHDWGYGGLLMCNLFALISTDPRGLARSEGPDPVGPGNDMYLRRHAAAAGIVVAAWGAFKQAARRAPSVVELLGPDLHCLGLTRAGAPRHPLFVPGATEPIAYEPGAHA